MTAIKAFVESREHERHQLNDGIAALSDSSATKFGRIRNISLGGLSVSHFDDEDWGGDAGFGSDLILAGYGFLIDDVPTRIVSDIKVIIDNPFQEISERQCSIKFEGLTPRQRARLEEIIREHSLGRDLTLRLDED